MIETGWANSETGLTGLPTPVLELESFNLLLSSWKVWM